MNITTRPQLTHYTIEYYNPRQNTFLNYYDTDYIHTMDTLEAIALYNDVLKFYYHKKVFKDVYVKGLTEHFTDTLAREFAQQDHDQFIDYFEYYIDNMEC